MPQSKEVKKQEAEKRQEAYNKLSVKEKLAQLDKYGFVATKQRKKLNDKLSTSN